MAEREKKRKKREKTERGGDKGKVSRVERATGRQRQTESIERPREHSEKVREREVVAKSFMKFLLPRYIRVTIKSRSPPPMVKHSGSTFFPLSLSSGVPTSKQEKLLDPVPLLLRSTSPGAYSVNQYVPSLAGFIEFIGIVGLRDLLGSARGDGNKKSPCDQGDPSDKSARRSDCVVSRQHCGRPLFRTPCAQRGSCRGCCECSLSEKGRMSAPSGFPN